MVQGRIGGGHLPGTIWCILIDKPHWDVIFNIMKKGKLEKPKPHNIPGSRKRQAKIQAILPNHLDRALSRSSWILVSSSYSAEAATISPSEPWTDVIVSTRVVLIWEISCSVSKVAWAATPMPVWKSERCWSILLLAGSQWNYLMAKKLRI